MSESQTNNYFQAFGVLKGLVKFAPETKHFTITYDGVEFPLLVPGGIKFALKKEIVHNPIVRCGVYPQYHLPTNSLKFLLISFNEVRQPQDCMFLESGEFVLRGIPQFLPQLRAVKLPALSVYRNRKLHEKDKIKPVHLPVSLYGSDVTVAKFVANEKPVHTFVQGLFQLSKRNEYFCFKFVKHLHPVSTEIPRYLKPKRDEDKPKDKTAKKPDDTKKKTKKVTPAAKTTEAKAIEKAKPKEPMAKKKLALSNIQIR